MRTTTTLICLAVCVLHAAAYFNPLSNFGLSGNVGYGGDNGKGYESNYGAGNGGGLGWNWGQQIRPQMQAINGSAIWVNAPVNGSFPTFVRANGSNTNGYTLTGFCEYVVANNSLPWSLPSDDISNIMQYFTMPSYYLIISRFCRNLVNNNGIFYIPSFQQFGK